MHIVSSLGKTGRESRDETRSAVDLGPEGISTHQDAEAGFALVGRGSGGVRHAVYRTSQLREALVSRVGQGSIRQHLRVVARQ